jgi:hypothetical protein
LLESAETWSTAAKLASGRTLVGTGFVFACRRTPNVEEGCASTLSRGVGPEGSVRVDLPLQSISPPTWSTMSTSGSSVACEAKGRLRQEADHGGSAMGLERFL